MKKISCLLVVICLVMLIDIINCAKKEIETDQEFCIRAAEKIIFNFEQELDSTLLKIMKSMEIADAVENFSFDAQMVSANYENNEYYLLKRVTDKNRNEFNLAQSYEQDVLSEFEYSSGNSSNTSSLWSSWGSKFDFYYFKAINIDSSCLVCHGSKEEIPLGALKKIREIYSNDKAVGYSDGDLRGIYVVMIKWPEAKESLELLLSKS